MLRKTPSAMTLDELVAEREGILDEVRGLNFDRVRDLWPLTNELRRRRGQLDGQQHLPL